MPTTRTDPDGESNESFESRSDRLMSLMLSPQSRQTRSDVPMSGTYRRTDPRSADV